MTAVGTITPAAPIQPPPVADDADEPDDDDATPARPTKPSVTESVTDDEQAAIDWWLETMHPGFIARRAKAGLSSRRHDDN
jgi:hypothetical protein